MEDRKVLTNEQLAGVNGGSIGEGIAVGAVYKKETEAYPYGAILYRPEHDTAFDTDTLGNHEFEYGKES